jgi:hypothetical protein
LEQHNLNDINKSVNLFSKTYSKFWVTLIIQKKRGFYYCLFLCIIKSKCEYGKIHQRLSCVGFQCLWKFWT